MEEKLSMKERTKKKIEEWKALAEQLNDQLHLEAAENER